MTVQWFEQILTGAITTPVALLAALKNKASTDARLQLLHDRVAACRDIQNWPRVVRSCTDVARYSFETGRLLATAVSRGATAAPTGHGNMIGIAVGNAGKTTRRRICRELADQVGLSSRRPGRRARRQRVRVG